MVRTKMGRRGTVDLKPVFIPWREDIEKLFLSFKREKILEQGNAEMGKTDMNLGDSHLENSRLSKLTMEVYSEHSNLKK